MSIRAFDWARGQETADFVSKAVLVALGALADPNDLSRVDVHELAEVVELDRKELREILAELELSALVICDRPINTGGIGRSRLNVAAGAIAKKNLVGASS